MIGNQNASKAKIDDRVEVRIIMIMKEFMCLFLGFYQVWLVGGQLY